MNVQLCYTLTLCILFFANSVFAGTPTVASGKNRIVLMPRDLEMELALSAAPRHLRGEAGVYLLRKHGYELVRESRNGFFCLVGRPEFGVESRTIEPIAYDAEAARTILLAVFDNAKFRAQGDNAATIERKIRAGFKNGTYKFPARTSMVYMQSGFLNLAVPGANGAFADNQGCFRFHPHTMVTGPNTSRGELGIKSLRAPNRDPWQPILTAQNSPVSYIVFPIGAKEMEQIKEEQKEMIAKAEAWLQSLE